MFNRTDTFWQLYMVVSEQRELVVNVTIMIIGRKEGHNFFLYIIKMLINKQVREGKRR